MSFTPRFQYTNQLVRALQRVEAARAVIDLLPLPPDAGLLLRQEARQRSTRSSTQIEGNPLSEREVQRAVRASDRTHSEAEQEVRNYWRALDRVEEWAAGKAPLTEEFICELHRIVIVRGAGRRGRRSAYRRHECPVVDTATGRIEYAPPTPQDVPGLMEDLVEWRASKAAGDLPGPIRAALLSHRFLSVHPFEDGNGRTGRLLATAELWRSSHRMRGFLSFDEYFAQERQAYYAAVQMGLPVNFYEGRHDPDHTPWLHFFVGVLARASSALLGRAAELHRAIAPPRPPWESLSRRQQQVLTRLAVPPATEAGRRPELRPGDIQDWFGVSANTARDWLRQWRDEGFLVDLPTPYGLRIRRYRLANAWQRLISGAQRGRENSTTPRLYGSRIKSGKRGRENT